MKTLFTFELFETIYENPYIIFDDDLEIVGSKTIFPIYRVSRAIPNYGSEYEANRRKREKLFIKFTIT